MHESERGLRYTLRSLLNRKLTPKETELRQQVAYDVAQRFSTDEEWSGWITGILLFGSMVNGKPRKKSDIDLAIITKQDNFFGLDYAWITQRLSESAKTYLQDIGKENLRIHCTICPQSWLDNPSGAGIRNPEFLEALKDAQPIYRKS
ncbi:MAG: hypothetical protein UT61_C0045G0015 [Candidatus Woesebacteria bacterium GW2011_GWA1_39_8]|jgi:predicted nucleotidyltransferase|uniref:Polymerase beta nucleotidyltransferase domain-containing protein n=1 Tax=Candidatus Woesebacteria bacterium GW2011_GWA1_39_8 TaxID=1618552 RepID=A0A0G0PKC1_9BACT|nr:MAG: hypothetical protein UT61_C0045G0015 [Candidatus Woesebacteria bacterium GW2011_GWA1_39_8]